MATFVENGAPDEGVAGDVDRPRVVTFEPDDERETRDRGDGVQTR